MSYLTLPAGIPDFSKAVISLWFRVPRETLVACANKAQKHDQAELALRRAVGYPSGYVFPRLNGIVPLMTFGQMFEGYQVKTENGNPIVYTADYASYSEHAGYSVYPWTETYTTTDGPVFTRFSQYLANPSYIGIKAVWEVDDNGNITDRLNTALQVRIQMRDKSRGLGSWVFTRPHYVFGSHTTLMSGNSEVGVEQDTAWWFSPWYECRREGVYPGGEWIKTTTLIDDTDLVAEQYGPESFESGFVIRDDNGQDKTIEPDKWHHLLFSFDLEHSMVAKGAKYVFDQPDCTVGNDHPARTGGPVEVVNAVEDPCKMWIALDDFNNLNVYPIGSVYGMGANDIMTENCRHAAAGLLTATAHEKVWHHTGLVLIAFQDTDFGTPTFAYSPSKIPSSGYPLGIPAIPELVDSVYRVEMAELQIFTGVNLDTGVVENRRAFVTDKGKPAALGFSQELFQKKPEVLLHGSANWKSGKNTGSLGQDNKGQIIESGQFQRTAKIEAYKPEPSLHGPQETPSA